MFFYTNRIFREVSVGQNLSSMSIHIYLIIRSFAYYFLFQVRKIGENLVISTTEKRLGSDRHTKPNWIRRITTEKPIIIVGGG